MFLAILLVNWNEKIRTDLLPISNLDFAILSCVMSKILFLPTKSQPDSVLENDAYVIIFRTCVIDKLSWTLKHKMTKEL